MSGQNENMEQLKLELGQAREVAGLLHVNWESALRSKRNLSRSVTHNGIESTVVDKLFDTFVKNSREEYMRAFENMCELSDRYTEAYSLSKSSEK
jgi:hypothetical protein